MTVEKDLCSGVSDTSKVEIEQINSLNMSSGEDQEKVGEVMDDSIVCETVEKSDGEVEEKGEGLCVIVSGGGDVGSDGLVHQNIAVLEEKPLSESSVEVVESDDSCNFDSDSSGKKDIAVDGLDEDILGNSESSTPTGILTLEPESSEGDIKPVEEDSVFEEKPLSESSKEKDVETVESDDSCNFESDSIGKQDVAVEGLDEDILGNSESATTTGLLTLEPEGEHVGDDEKSEEMKLDTMVEMESDQPELQQLDNLNSTKENDDGGIVDSGDDQDSSYTCMEAVEDKSSDSAGDVVEDQESVVIVSENSDSAKSEHDVSVDESSQYLTKEEQGLELQIDTSHVNNMQIEVEDTNCTSESGDSLEVIAEEVKEDGDRSSHETAEVTDEEAKEDGHSYVFVDGVDVVSDDTAEIEHIIDDITHITSGYPHFVVGSIVCGPHPISVSSTDNSLCSIDNAKLGSTSSSGTDTLDEKVNQKMKRKSVFHWLVKVPRYTNDKIGEQIRFALLQVDEMTQKRDSIRVEVLAKKDACKASRAKFEAAKSAENAAYNAQYVKRRERDSVQSMFNRLKNANSVEEFGDRIRNMQRRIEHETIPLKEEKQLIREIKELKHQRQQLSSILDRQAEMQPTLHQKEELEERLKLLKQNLDSARKEIVQIEVITNAARKMDFDENEKLRDMQAQFRSVNDLRQKAYAHIQKLKKQLYDKNKDFRMYKDDVRKAEEYGFSGDREALHSHCDKQVEKFKELFNKDDDFRNEYLRCNSVSTVRRLGTLDGCLIGHEDSPIIRKIGDEKSVLPLGPKKAEEKSVVKQEEKHPTAQSNEIMPFVLENSSATVSGKEEVEDKTEEGNKQTQEEEELARKQNKQTQEEEELARKDDEFRKEAAAAEIREQLLLTERSKAKEAEDRKRRNAEKAQVRGQLKAQKEAEHKEKERAKKERRKANKATKCISEKELSVPRSECMLPEPNSQGPEPETMLTGEKQPKTAWKRPQKPSVLAKKSKTIVVPPPLRRKNKKRMQPYMWVLLTALLVLAAVIFLPSLRHALNLL